MVQECILVIFPKNDIPVPILDFREGFCFLTIRAMHVFDVPQFALFRPFSVKHHLRSAFLADELALDHYLIFLSGHFQHSILLNDKSQGTVLKKTNGYPNRLQPFDVLIIHLKMR